MVIPPSMIYYKSQFKNVKENIQGTLGQILAISVISSLLYQS